MIPARRLMRWSSVPEDIEASQANLAAVLFTIRIPSK